MFFYAFSIEPPLRWNVNCFFEKFLTFSPTLRRRLAGNSLFSREIQGLQGNITIDLGTKKEGSTWASASFRLFFPSAAPDIQGAAC